MEISDDDDDEGSMCYCFAPTCLYSSFESSSGHPLFLILAIFVPFRIVPTIRDEPTKESGGVTALHVDGNGPAVAVAVVTPLTAAPQVTTPVVTSSNIFGPFDPEAGFTAIIEDSPATTVALDFEPAWDSGIIQRSRTRILVREMILLSLSRFLSHFLLL